MNDIVESGLEAAAKKLLAHGAQHHWFEQYDLETMDPIGRGEFLAIVESVVAAYRDAKITHRRAALAAERDRCAGIAKAKADEAREFFKSEKEAYDFCRQVYNETGGPTQELLRAYEFYLNNCNDNCDPFVGPERSPSQSSQ
jgi:hypothetical protein